MDTEIPVAPELSKKDNQPVPNCYDCDAGNTDNTTQLPKVTLPPSPGMDVPDEVGEEDDSTMSHWWVTSMSNAALMAVHSINRMDDISKLSVQHDYSIKDGSLKRRVEIDFTNCNKSSIVRMHAPYV